MIGKVRSRTDLVEALANGGCAVSDDDPNVCGHRDGCWITTHGSAMLVQDGDLAADDVRGAEAIPQVGVTRDDPQRNSLTAAADQDRQSRLYRLRP